MKTIKHIIKLTVEGYIIFAILMSMMAGIVYVLPFSFFVNISESGYIDQPAPVSELLFINNRYAIDDISASAIREIQRIEDDKIIQHPELILTTFVYEKSSNNQDIIIPLPFKNYPIVDKGLYSVSETVTLEIPVWFFKVKKTHTFNNSNFTVL